MSLDSCPVAHGKHNIDHHAEATLIALLAQATKAKFLERNYGGHLWPLARFPIPSSKYTHPTSDRSSTNMMGTIASVYMRAFQYFEYIACFAPEYIDRNLYSCTAIMKDLLSSFTRNVNSCYNCRDVRKNVPGCQ